MTYSETLVRQERYDKLMLPLANPHILRPQKDLGWHHSSKMILNRYRSRSHYRNLCLRIPIPVFDMKLLIIARETFLLHCNVVKKIFYFDQCSIRLTEIFIVKNT